MYAGPMLGYGRRIAAEIERLLRGVDHPAARALVASRGARGTGIDGEWTRRDHRRTLALGVSLLLIGWVSGFVIFSIADRQPLGSRWNTILSGVGLFFVLGGSYLGWYGLKHLRPAFSRSASKSS